MSLRLAGFLGSFGIGLLSGVATAQDVSVPLPDAQNDLIVDLDRRTDFRLRELPKESVPVVIRPDDIAGAEAALPSVPRGPLADRLFEALPWSSGPVASQPEVAGTVAASITVEPLAAAVDPAMRDAVLAALNQQTPDRKLGKSELRQLAEYYEAKGNTVLWHDGAERNAKAEEVLAVIRTAEQDGLDIAAYAAAAPLDSTPEAIALADVALSRAVIAYARDASGARILNPAKLSQMIDAKPDVPGVPAVLGALELSDDAGTRLQQFNPQQPGYKALKAALAELRSADDAPAARVPSGKTLRLGESDERVVSLRQRLGTGPVDDETLFDEQLAEAVKAFQRENGIRATGILNQITTAALNGDSVPGLKAGRVTEADLISNMERWRWMPRDLGYNHIYVNIPEFRLQIIENDVMTHETRVVVGKSATQTPIFSDEVEFVVVNPTWTVPPSIALKEYLPKLRDNPYALQGRGFEIVRNGKPIDPGSVDWYSPPSNVAIRQPPGERNALGHIKFMFPNKHAVYLHDTPKKQYFDQDVRAESHGCVRVADPFALAEVVLGEGWPEERVKRLIGGRSERTITLARHMPVHLAYFTIAIGSDGKPVKFGDIYGHDARVRRALGL